MEPLAIKGALAQRGDVLRIVFASTLVTVGAGIRYIMESQI
jgi:hypothetical protein